MMPTEEKEIKDHTREAVFGLLRRIGIPLGRTELEQGFEEAWKLQKASLILSWINEDSNQGAAIVSLMAGISFGYTIGFKRGSIAKS